MESAPVVESKLVLAQTPRSEVAAVVLAPRWRLGRRAACRKAVEQAAARWLPRVERLYVAAEAAAAPAMRAAGFEVLIVPRTALTLSAAAAALEACASDPLLIVDCETDVAPATVQSMLAALREDELSGAVALVGAGGLRDFPLLCRNAVKPLIDALLVSGQGDVADLMRRPCARFVLTDL